MSLLFDSNDDDDHDFDAKYLRLSAKVFLVLIKKAKNWQNWNQKVTCGFDSLLGQLKGGSCLFSCNDKIAIFIAQYKFLSALIFVPLLLRRRWLQ